MKKKVNDVKDRVLSDENIFLSIYLSNSYILNKELLTWEDRILLSKLQDVFDNVTIDNTISEVKKRLNDILSIEESFFNINVYFKPKKYKDNNIVFRPLHTATVIEQIAMTAILLVLVYDIDESGRLSLSDLSRLLPSNFYGNRISCNARELFKPWREQYMEYTEMANEALIKYCDTQEYKYEVSLDLENFFPSINPQILYNFLQEHLPLQLNSSERETMELLLRKLLIFNLEQISTKECEWYLGDSASIRSGNALRELCMFAKGIPQGLPHSYFLANIFMLIIKDIYLKRFDGDMFFYVDDSVIFTNGVNGKLNSKIFERAINNLNFDIMDREESLLKDKPSIFPRNYVYVSADFGTKVHDAGEKSVFSKIIEAKNNSGMQYLRGLCREVSKTGVDMYTAFSDEEVKMVESRTKAVLDLINRELEADPEEGVYREKLVRYRKYFGYRYTILSYKSKSDKDLEKLRDELVDELRLVDDEERDWQAFFNRYSDDILAATIDFVFNKCTNGGICISPLVEVVKNLISEMYGNYSKHSYLLKAYDRFWEAWPYDIVIDTYGTLKIAITKQCRAAREQLQARKYAKFEEYTSSICTKDKALGQCYKKLYEELGLQRVFQYSKYIRLNTNEFERMIMNCLYSYIFCYEVDDRFTFAKKSREIEYAEIRVLSILRNCFDMDSFVSNYNFYVGQDCCQTADYALLQVLEIFKTFVSDPEWIDNLIMVHKYCCDTWKNRSKYLHFYTLHNQEHAICLIKSAIKLIHGISHFQLKNIDYYIFFAACYLHDISMVTLPDPSKFYNEDSLSADEIYSDFIIGFTKNEDYPVKIKKQLCDYSQKIDTFFEKDVRENHAKNSAQEIRSHSELDFIEASTREVIAEVSEAHAYDTADVYLCKSDAHTALINKKMITILLRLSDLLDMSRYRISKLILDHNMKNLNEISRFHWLSHLLTDSYDLETLYSLDNVIENSRLTHIQNHMIVEKLVLHVDVLMSQTAKVSSGRCMYISTSKLTKKNGKMSIRIQCKQDAICASKKKCNFLCKWFTMKNYYLFKEFAALRDYLNSLRNYFYSSEIEVIVNVISSTDIPSDAFDYLREYVD